MISQDISYSLEHTHFYDGAGQMTESYISCPYSFHMHIAFISLLWTLQLFISFYLILTNFTYLNIIWAQLITHLVDAITFRGAFSCHVSAAHTSTPPPVWWSAGFHRVSSTEIMIQAAFLLLFSWMSVWRRCLFGCSVNSRSALPVCRLHQGIKGKFLHWKKVQSWCIG